MKGHNETRDKQRLSLQTHALITRSYYQLAKRLGISYTMLRDLIALCDYHKTHGKGISPADLNNFFGCSHGTYRNLFDRLGSLQAKGFIYNVNRTYYPTDKSIQALRGLCVI